MAKANHKYNIKLDIVLIAALMILCGIFVLAVPNCVTGSVTGPADSGDESSSILDPEHMVYGALVDVKIVLRFGDKKETLTSDQITDWVKVKKDDKGFSYTVDEEKIGSYVQELDKKYSTYEPYVDFHTTYGETVRLDNNSTGWIFNTEYAAAQLEDFITDCRSVDIDLTDRSEESNAWWIRTSADYKADVSNVNTYVEVSIDSQYMWVYKNGKVVLESSVVTGNPNLGNDTPKGAYIIYEKKSPSQLYGDGYNTEVAYWMAFNDDIGFHDADWQDDFGGSVYLENGSHGCVNLPDYVAAELYGIVEINMPVFVY